MTLLKMVTYEGQTDGPCYTRDCWGGGEGRGSRAAHDGTTSLIAVLKPTWFKFPGLCVLNAGVFIWQNPHRNVVGPTTIVESRIPFSDS